MVVSELWDIPPMSGNLSIIKHSQLYSNRIDLMCDIYPIFNRSKVGQMNDNIYYSLQKIGYWKHA